MTDIFQTLIQLVLVLFKLVVELLALGLHWFLLLFWVAWWLCGVNWKKAWPVLAQGAWLPLVLITVVGALVWSQIAPSTCYCLGFTSVPNFWWQLGASGLLVGSALFAGWLQGIMKWAPPEINLEPPAHGGGHDHGHGHDDAHDHVPPHHAAEPMGNGHHAG